MSNQKKNNITTVIAKRELKSFFTSPVAYIVTALFLIAVGIFFYSTFFLNKKAELRIFFSILPYAFTVFVPALTMRLFAEEQKTGSIETLMTPCNRKSGSSRKIFCSLYYKHCNADSYTIVCNHTNLLRKTGLRSYHWRIYWSNSFMCSVFCNWNICFINY